MRRIWIDFRQPVPPRMRALRITLLACGVLVLGVSLVRQQQVNAEKIALSWQLQSLSRLESRKLPQLRTLAAPGTSPDATRYANDILRQLNLPWDTLFTALERSATMDISILSVAPDPHKASITLKAAAPDTNAAIDFVERLQSTGLLTGVHLTNQENGSEGKQHPLQFTLTATWGRTP